MATPELDVAPVGHRGPRATILLALKRRERMTAKDVAVLLGVSMNAARHHLKELESEGLIRYERAHRGVGAPAHAFLLTPAAEALFPRRYESVLMEVLEAVERRQGRTAAVAALQARFDDLAGRVEAEIAPSATPQERLVALTRVLTDEGYMAEAAVGHCCGTLTEHNCPLPAVAGRFPELCEAERAFLERIVGVRVERKARIMDGCAACQYKVRWQEATGEPT